MAEQGARVQLEPQAVALYGVVKPGGRSYTDAEIGEQLGVSATSIRNWRNSNKDAWEQARSPGGGLLLRLRQLLDGAVAGLEQLGRPKSLRCFGRQERFLSMRIIRTFMV